MRESLLETMRLMCEAVHPNRLGMDYVFEARNELLAYVKVRSRSLEPRRSPGETRIREVSCWPAGLCEGKI